MDLRRVCKLLLTSVSPCQQAPRNKMAVLAELSQFTWSGVRPDDAWERPRIQVVWQRTRPKILRKRVVRDFRSNIGSNRQKQHLFTSITLFCTFLCRHCTAMTGKWLVSRFMEDVNKRRLNLLSLSILECGSWEFGSKRVRLNST